jgi:hypothetical protein
MLAVLEQKWCCVSLAALGLGLSFCGCRSVEREVAVRYTLVPDKCDLLKTDPADPIRICVSTVDVRSGGEWSDPRQGIPQTWTYTYQVGTEPAQTATLRFGPVSNDHTQQNCKHWEDLCRGEIARKLKAGADTDGAYVTMVDRDALPQIVRESDLKKGDLVDADVRLAKIKQLGVDLFVFGTVDVVTRYDVTWKRDMAARIVNWIPWLHGAADDSPKQQIRRTITFAGNFRVIDAATGEQHLQQAFNEQAYEDKKPTPLIGSSMTTMDLEPEEQIIRRFLQQELDRFVGRLVPVLVTEPIWVQASRNGDCVQGVQALGAGDCTAALARFQAALATDPKDHRALFGAGVALECLHRLPEAQDRYGQAKNMIGGSRKDRKGRDTSGDKRACSAATERVAERMRRGEKLTVAAETAGNGNYLVQNVR